MKEPSIARSWLLSAALCLSVAVWCGDGTGVPFAMIWLFAGLTAGTVALNGGKFSQLEQWGSLLASVLILVSSSLAFLKSPGVYLEASASTSAHHWFFLKTLAIASGVAAWFSGGNKARVLFLVCLFASFEGIVWVLSNAPNPIIDVVHFFRDGTDAILHGKNPYEISMANIYGPETRLYAASLIDGERLKFGFPYPAVTLLAGAIGQILAHDYRFLFAGVFILGLGIFGLRNDFSRQAVLCLILNPRLEFVFEQGWTDGLTSGLLAAALGLFPFLPLGATLLTALWICSKPYFLPFAVLANPFDRDQAARKRTFLLWGMVILFYGIPLLISFHSYLWSCFTIQFVQPVRPDSLSFLFSHGGLLPAALVIWLCGLVPFLRHPVLLMQSANARFLLLAWLLFGFFAFNKQAFANYYFSLISVLALGSTLPFSTSKTQCPS